MTLIDTLFAVAIGVIFGGVIKSIFATIFARMFPAASLVAKTAGVLTQAVPEVPHWVGVVEKLIATQHAERTGTAATPSDFETSVKAIVAPMIRDEIQAGFAALLARNTPPPTVAAAKA